MKNNTSEVLSLKSFQRLSNLNHEELLNILSDGGLPLVLGDKGEVLVDLDQLSIDELAQAKVKSKFAQPQIDQSTKLELEEILSLIHI